MPNATRLRANPQADAEIAAINQIMILRDYCELFDGGRDHHFISMAVALRALCHSGSSGCLLNNIREKGRSFPSSVGRELREMASGASDHFHVADVGGEMRVLPRLDLTATEMKTKKFKNWWSEIIVTDEQRRGISRGNLIIAIANSEGGTHFTEHVDEIYDEIARHNGLGLWANRDGAWRDYGLLPIQAIVRQIAHEFLLGIEDWIQAKRDNWAYRPVVVEPTGHAIAPGFQLVFRPA